MKLLSPGGQALIYVWAYEQERNKVKSKYLQKNKNIGEEQITGSTSAANDNRQTSVRCQIDTCTESSQACSDFPTDVTTTSDSYVSDTDVTTSSCASVNSKGNQIIHCSPSSAEETDKNDLKVHVNRTNFEAQDLLVPWHLKGQKKSMDQSTEAKNTPGHPVFHRYYHVFHEGELEELCRQIDNVKIVRSYYDQGNWCVILEKV